MNPAFSVILFTTIAGAAQGLVVALALVMGVGLPVTAGFASRVLLGAEAMLLVGLGASFAHLGRPERAWRAVLMWRTSWLSREVIVLPVFMALVGLWWLVLRSGANPWQLPLVVVVVAGLLWWCTAMIYACIRFIQEWAQPLTVVNFVLIGLSSGLLLFCALAASAGQGAALRAVGPWALGLTLLAWLTRGLALRRNAGLKPKSSLQSATGIPAAPLVQKAMGMTAGSFNTREFFHGRSLATLHQVKWMFLWLCFALPAGLALCGLLLHSTWPWMLAVLVQAPGLLAERWYFFAQARHPQNLYYQVVS